MRLKTEEEDDVSAA